MCLLLNEFIEGQLGQFDAGALYRLHMSESVHYRSFVRESAVRGVVLGRRRLPRPEQVDVRECYSFLGCGETLGSQVVGLQARTPGYYGGSRGLLEGVTEGTLEVKLQIL